jgi:hypothetical protein
VIKRVRTMKRMAQPGHYHPPKLMGGSGMNLPRRGRVGKQQPQFKKMPPPGVKRRG